MKKKLQTGMAVVIIIAGICSGKDVRAEAATINTMVPAVGVGAVLELPVSEDECLQAAAQACVYGYQNLGIANVDNHLNVRETPEENGKLVGKMSKDAACEITETEGNWAKITSGDVEGYVNLDFLFTGSQARQKAEEVVTTVAIANAGGLRVREEPNTDCPIVTTVAEGEALEVVSEDSDWIEVMLDDETAYVSAEYIDVKKELSTAVTMTELLYGEGVSDVRVDLCQYAKEFIGNPYVWGGTSLTNGADCSGFVLSIFSKYGISLPHSAAAQSGLGTRVSASEAKAGDLVFYAKNGRINHVGIYLGGGQVIHASNPKTGIRISAVSYRTPSCFVRMLTE